MDHHQFQLHPLFPAVRPLVIAHRAGNDLALARAARERGADMIETDVWRYRGRLEIRHLKTLGPLPILWDRWEIHPGWGHRLQLAELLDALPVDARLFLDLKGEDLELGPAIVALVRERQPDREIVLCGRNWPQLDAVREAGDVTLFYSVGSDEELARIWSRLDAMLHPAVSIHCRYLTPENVRRFRDLGTMIVTWPINTLAMGGQLHDLNVDGFTTDSPEVIDAVVRTRESGFLATPAPPGAASTRT